MGSGQSGQWYALATGTILRDYTIESVLGQGGFGIVYRARHNEVGHLVAIKEFLPVELVARVRDTVTPRNEDCEEHFEDGLRRFRDEARALIKLNGHPNIVACMDFFRANGTAYLVMEFVDGQPLAEVLRRREAEGCPFEEAELLAVAVPLVEGLAHVHRQGVLHRDIKPANILIRRADGLPILIDFGAAKQLVAEQTRSFAPYTEGYAALEQVSGGELGPWTDLYGFGAVMWRVLAGGNHAWKQSNPTKVESRMSARLRGDRDPLPSGRQLGGERFSVSVVGVIDRCLELNPEERIRNCDELLDILNGDARPAQKDYLPPIQPFERSKTPGEEHQGHGDDQVQVDPSRQVQSNPPETNTRRSSNEKPDLPTRVRTVWRRLMGTFRGSRRTFSEISTDRSATRQMVVSVYIAGILHSISPKWESGFVYIVFYALGGLARTLGSVACTALAYRIVAKRFSPMAPSYGSWFRVLGFTTAVCVPIALVPFVGWYTSIFYNFVLNVVATSELSCTKIRVALTIALIAELLGGIPDFIYGFVMAQLGATA